MRNNFLYPLLAALISGIIVAVFSYYILSGPVRSMDLEVTESAIVFPFDTSSPALKEKISSTFQIKPEAMKLFGDISDIVAQYHDSFMLRRYDLSNTGNSIYKSVKIFISGYYIVSIKYNNKIDTIFGDTQLSYDLMPGQDIQLVGLAPGSNSIFGSIISTGKVVFSYNDAVVPRTDITLNRDEDFYYLYSIIKNNPFISFIVVLLSMITWIIVIVSIVFGLFSRRNLELHSKTISDPALAGHFRVLRFIRVNDPDRLKKIISEVRRQDARAESKST